MTVDGCSVEYERKLVCQLACVVAHRLLYTFVMPICSTSLQGHINRFSTGLLLQSTGSSCPSVQVHAEEVVLRSQTSAWRESLVPTLTPTGVGEK